MKTLTKCQQECIEYVQKGLTYAQIGRLLGKSPRTVGHHVAAALKKLGARTRYELSQKIAIGRNY